MRNYFIDFPKISKDLLPHFLQTKGVLSWITSGDFFWVTAEGDSWTTGSASRHLAWLRVLVSPLTTLNAVFRAFVDNTRYSMYLTGQVIYLEHYLNDIFDPIVRRIYIEDGDASVTLFLNRKPDQPIIIYNKSESVSAPILLTKEDLLNTADFCVVIPYQNITALGIAQLNARVKQYKQAGKRFKIVTTFGGPSWPTTI